MKDLVISPFTINLITTNKCTAKCKDCCFGCNPNQNDRMSLQQMKDYILNSMFYYSNIKLLVLTGGECFTLGKDLEKIVKFGKEMELSVRVVTNCFWAVSFKRAYKKLKKMKECGLTEFNISTGDEHQKWVPYDNIVYAVVAVIKLDITTVINVESNVTHSFTSEIIKNDVRIKPYYDKFKNQKLFILDGIWMAFTKSTQQEMETKKQNSTYSYSKKRCTSLFSTISINTQEVMHACCGLTSENNQYMILGNINKKSINEIYEYQFNDFIKIWLYTEGPFAILNFIKANGGTLKNQNYLDSHMCEQCALLFENENNIEILNKIIIKCLQI